MKAILIPAWVAMRLTTINSMKKPKKKKGTWGGARERKVKKEKTKVMRVPVSLVAHVVGLIKR